MNTPFSRRELLARTGAGLGSLALGRLASADDAGGQVFGTHHPPRAKRVIYLFQSGGPSQLDLFDH